MPEPILFGGDTRLRHAETVVQGDFVALLGEPFYRIRHYDALAPFFISLVSGSDLWLYIASTGGLTAGRVSAERALFPYYTVDKITESSEHTGAKTILLVTQARRQSLWEPFSIRQQGLYQVERNLYKDVVGTTLVFEEINRDLGLTFRYAWRTSDAHGFVKTAWLHNTHSAACQVELVDGLQNILPANVASQTQNAFSVLLDAYKRSELEPGTGLGLFSLSSRLTDLAEPSESLLATAVAQVGLEAAGYLLSSDQLDRFRRGLGLTPETDVRGRRGAYLVHARLTLEPDALRTWHILADVHQDSAAVARRRRLLRDDPAAVYQVIEQDIAASQAELLALIDQADGAQLTRAPLYTTHHLANVLFNIARGGIFANQYWIDAADLRDFVAQHHPALLETDRGFWEALPARLSLPDMQARAAASPSADLRRLCGAYLPLTFSRRHGDPSRPWNVFTLELKQADGSPRLGYEGNWRDIFQNWEALAYAYPEYVEAMLAVFLNATTLDGYNPYRIRRAGVDWELPEPENPWSNIGYWSDHQIVYLQKLLEASASLHPGRLAAAVSQPAYSYANVPYRLKPYADLVRDPRRAIDFDWDRQAEIEARMRAGGMDGRLVHTPAGAVYHAALAEKLLTLLLAKLVNFVPEGGLWMNTQRPEWNDANNALVGNGLSVVTLSYLRRFLVGSQALLADAGPTAPVSVEVYHYYTQVAAILARFEPVLDGAFTPETRRALMDALGQAGGDYRQACYTQGVSGQLVAVPLAAVTDFLALAQRYIEHTLRANRRADNLYHAYNILHLEPGRATISPLAEMLEGQVAILSSGYLSGPEAVALLDSLRHSALYCADQHSYLLYPNRDLPGFLAKNRLPAALVQDLALVQALTAAGDTSLMTRDVDGYYHFSGGLRNAHDAARVLDELRDRPALAGLVEREADQILALFEATFHHAEFTGRSGTFFAYEGLGSIYWHMVSKLLLAVQEAAWNARPGPAAAALRERYRDIRAGLGFNKPPDRYGAFPTDPYSHTPQGQGAQQPGLTGMVKEELLTRPAELGLRLQAGQLVFDRFLLDPQELLAAPAVFSWRDVAGRQQSLSLSAGSLAYTFCQVPIVVQLAETAGLTVHWADGRQQSLSGLSLDVASSRHIFQRDGQIHHLGVSFAPE